MEKYGWHYIVTGNENNIKMEVIPHQNKIKQLPETLFKIYSLNSNSIDALLNSYIYGSHPSEFNDLFDCHIDLIEWDDIELIKENLSKIIYNKNEFILLINSKYKLASIKLFYNILYSKIGIFSLTENIDNILMWSHYCNNSGFAIEFDIQELKNNNFKSYGPFQVNYQESLKKVALSDFKENVFLYQTNVKSNLWEYENEWRLLLEPPLEKSLKIPDLKFPQLNAIERKFYYDKLSIKKIYLGNRFFKEKELSIINDNIIDIKIKDNLEKKTCILSYFSENDIILGICLRAESLSQINFRLCKLEKISITKYKLIVLD